MPEITFLPAGKTLNVEPGTPVAEAARVADLQIDMPCGGEGVCGDCGVIVRSGDCDKGKSLGILSEKKIAGHYVLACSSLVKETPLVIEIPRLKDREGGQFVDVTDRRDLIQPDILPGEADLRFLSTRLSFHVPSPEQQPGLSDLDRLNQTLLSISGQKAVEYPLAILRSLAHVLRKEEGRVTVTLVEETTGCRMIDIKSDELSREHYAIAVDIGTTTVAVQLVEIPSANVVATASDYNGQIDCGLDVISRINFSGKTSGLETLRLKVLETVNKLIDRLCRQNSIDSRDICTAFVSGNTTMTHLLLGLDPKFIRLDPYIPTVYQTPRFSAEDVGMQIHSLAPVVLSPAVGSYVGGDITAGLLCCDLAYGKEEINLYMDIGTNGELVLGNKDFLVTCACSAGPAFEGGGMSCGMRAAYGAIDRVEVDPETGNLTYSTIGNGSPRGICGSGVISLLAKLYLTGWLDPSGRLNRDRPSSAIRIDGRRAAYVLVAAGDSYTGEPIVLTESDIENVIRAKAAVYAACCLMLEQVGITFENIERVYISGGFGRFLDIESARAIGLIPDLPADTFRYLGNASLTGTFMALVSEKHRRQLLSNAQRLTYLELNVDPSYMDQYTAALFIPHTDLDRFPGIRYVPPAG